jgi:hypothetical protein
VYWIKFYVKGKPHYLSAKTEKKREADTLLSFYLGQVARGEFRGLHEEPLFMQSLFDDFIADCTRRKLRSLDTIVYHLNPVRVWSAHKAAEEITARDIKRYKDHRLAQGRETATVNRELQYLCQAFRLAHANELIARIPRIKKDAEDNARQGFFQKADFDRLLAALPEDLRDFIHFGYLTGWGTGSV